MNFFRALTECSTKHHKFCSQGPTKVHLFTSVFQIHYYSTLSLILMKRIMQYMSIPLQGYSLAELYISMQYTTSLNKWNILFICHSAIKHWSWKSELQETLTLIFCASSHMYRKKKHQLTSWILKSIALCAHHKIMGKKSQFKLRSKV